MRAAFWNSSRWPRHSFVAITYGLLAMTCCPLAIGADDDAKGRAFFEKKIRPVLVKHCYECHSAKEDKLEGGLGVDSRKAIRAGGDRGPAVVPNDVDESLLIGALKYEDEDLEMPPSGKLSEEIIADFVKWIEMGAPDPRDGKAKQPSKTIAAIDANKLWSLKPLNAEMAEAVDGTWHESTIDQYIAVGLQKAGLKPSPDGNAHQLVRRVHFDLTGLPPSATAAREWANRLVNKGVWQQSQWEQLVDRLLAEPTFGQRWGRHWLDVSRYAESNGKSRDVLFPHAWRYRDWVVDAWNDDLPMSDFVAQQIAGDLLPFDTPEQRERQQVATGFLAIGSKPLVGGALLKPSIVDDQIDVVTRGFLGLTAACARCHDHKFDPIPTADYYALAGIFNSTETFYGGGLRRPKTPADAAKVWMVLGGDSEKIKHAGALQAKLAKLTKVSAAATKRLQKLRKTKAAEEAGAPLLNATKAAADARAKLAAVRKELDAIKLRFAMGVGEGKPADSPVYIRGEPQQRGPIVPRGALSCVPGEPIRLQANGSGRLELARWVTAPSNPLAWRVMANRIWQHLFGEGLVSTVDNFGSMGEPPSHPALLDYLAQQLQSDGRRKPLVREIVLSRAYRLSNEFQPEAHASDPENRYLWRQRRRRLEVEAIRDSLLAAGGCLDLQPRNGSAVAEIGEGEVGRGIDEKPLIAPYYGRTMYLPVLRTALDDLLKTFDFPDPSNLQGRRDVTNVPLQSLYLMNNPFVWEMASRLGQKVWEASADARIDLVYWTCIGRPCTEPEREQASRFVDSWDGDPQEAWTVLCHSFFASSEFRYVE